MKNFNTIIFIFSLSILLGACITSSHSTKKAKSPSYLTVESKIIYENNERATFKITNESQEEELFLSHPEEIEIEKQTKSGWKDIKVLYCPCGASCPPPPQWGVLKPQGTRTVSWNLKEQWCEGTSLHGNIPKTKTKYAGKGNYRFVVRYTLNKDKEKITYYKNFQLESR
jgi:hypothetical protein